MSDVVYALGDIHGRLDLLERAENVLSIVSKKIPANQPSVKLMGDFIDHGPDSKGVLDKILSSSLAGMPMECMLGNHDMWLSRVVSMIRSNNTSCVAWLNESTLATIRSYGINVDSVPKSQDEKIKLLIKFARNVPEEHLIYIKDHTSVLSVDAGTIFVHAGIDKRYDLNNQNIDICINGPNNPGGFPESGWDDDMPVVMGHLVKSSPFISRNLKIIDLDTDAWETGILTCGIISNGKIAGFLAITPKSGIDFTPVIHDDVSIPLSLFKYTAKWWKDVFASCKDIPVLVFSDPKRKEYFCQLTGLVRFKSSPNIGAYKKEGYRIMLPISTSNN